MVSLELICIVCPKGCRLEGEEKEGTVTVKGGCKRGEEYAYREVKHPCRIVTTTVPIRGGEFSRLPVRTSAPFPKKKIPDLMIFLRSLEVEAPIRVGEVVAENLLGEKGVHLLATRTVKGKNGVSGKG